MGNIEFRSNELLWGKFSYSTNTDVENNAVRKNTPYYYQDLDNIQFILRHFEEPLFPRTISTKSTKNKQIEVNNIDQLYVEFERSNFIDCRINAFPRIEKPVPNLLFIDLDNLHRNISLDNMLEITFQNIKKRLSGFPTILWSGNGYHVYQPILAPKSLENLENFNGFDNPDNQFLRFEKDYLSDDFADKSNYPSLKSCMLRVPGSINSKCMLKGMKDIDSRVKIIKSWDGIRPHIRNQLGTFYSHLVSEKIENQKNIRLNNGIWKYSTSEIRWIEKLLGLSLEDYRKFCLWRILVPYLVNIKKISSPQVYVILEEWLVGCNTKRRLDFKPKITIRSYMKSVNEFKPISLSRLKKENPDLINMIKRIP